MVGVLNYLLSKVDIKRKVEYKYNNHHIVLRTGNYGTRDYTMEHARENVIQVYGSINDSHNRVLIHTGVHYYMHTHMYKSSIVLMFPKDLYKTNNGKKKITNNLKNIKTFLKKVDNLFYG